MIFFILNNFSYQLAVIMLKVTLLCADISFRSAYFTSKFFYFKINKLVLIMITKYRNRLSRQKAIDHFAEIQKKRIQKSAYL